ncbi:hypothetical protein AAVH_23511 [Aphelenchoides avenae]|nr:hypothetical protein AAVH_23511 [Aphelenchus avenae]
MIFSNSVVAISDLIIDVFQFLRRKELDRLQIVSRRFNAIIETKMTMVCLRLLKSAKILRSSAQRQFMLVMDEVGSKKMTRLPTGVNDEAAANTLLVNACKTSRLGSLELYGTTPMDVDFFDALVLCAPTILLKDFCVGNRTLSGAVSLDIVLGVLRKFAELKWTTTGTMQDAHLQNCLIRTCFKASVTLRSHRNDDGGLAIGDTALVENALMEFCFGACDEKYATRGRYLQLNFQTTPKKDFMQRWIEKAEVLDCRHKLTLEISSWQVPLRQGTTALDVYKRSQPEWTTRFESVNGRRWTAECTNYGDSKLTLQISQ